MRNYSYSEVRDMVAEALSFPGPNGIYSEVLENVRVLIREREGLPTPPHPSYGEQLSPQIIESVRDAFWEFIRLGAVTPGRLDQSASLPHFRLSPFGRDILIRQQSRFYDAETYVKQVETAVPDIDRVALAYLREAAACFFNNCLFACAVMLGAAAEAEFERLANLVVLHPQHGASFKGVNKPSQVAPRMELLHKRLCELDKLLPREIKENLTTTYRGIQDLLRVSRNEAGHPAERQIDRDFAFAQLALFIPFARQVAACRNYFTMA